MTETRRAQSAPEKQTGTMKIDVAIGHRIYGYTETSRQFHRKLRVSFPFVEEFDAEATGQFLKETFSFDAELCPPPRFVTDPDLTVAEKAFVTAFCQLARNLLQACGVPAFDIETVARQTGEEPDTQCQLVIDIPAIENVDHRLFSRIYRKSGEIVARLGCPPGDRPAAKTLADDLNEALLKPLQHFVNVRPLDTFILREAFRQGMQINHRGNAVYRLGVGARGHLFSRSATDGDPAIGVRASNDKWTTLGWLRDSGIPVPRSELVTTEDGAKASAARTGFPVVIKPADRDRSEGVTMDIGTEAEVESAFAAAQKWSDRILVEERVPGVCHRLVTFRNQFVFAFTRHPKSVVGDGKGTVAELIKAATAENDLLAEHLKKKPFPQDDEAKACLAEQGLDMSSVPAEDQIVRLREVNDRDSGGHNEVITDDVHSENKALAERVSRLMRLESMGLDLISEDPTRPWYETGARITEVNSTPQIGENSAAAYLRMAFEEGWGHIPVHCFVGDADALAAGQSFLGELAGNGTRAYLVSPGNVYGPDGAAIAGHGLQGLFDRTTALSNDPDVEAMILVIQDDEFLLRGRPVLRVESVVHVNDGLTLFRDAQQSLDQRRIGALLKTIRGGLAESPENTERNR